MELKEKKFSFKGTIMPLKELADRENMTLLDLYISVLPPDYKRADLVPEVLKIITNDYHDDFTEDEASEVLLSFFTKLDFGRRRKQVNSVFGLQEQTEKALQGAFVEVLKSEIKSKAKKSDS